MEVQLDFRRLLDIVEHTQSVHPLQSAAEGGATQQPDMLLLEMGAADDDAAIGELHVLTVLANTPLFTTRSGKKRRREADAADGNGEDMSAALELLEALQMDDAAPEEEPRTIIQSMPSGVQTWSGRARMFVAFQKL